MRWFCPKWLPRILAALILLSLSFSLIYAEERIRLATTTSTESSGLLGVMLPPFEERFGVVVDVIAVGTGKALKFGENGEVDVVLVHAPAAEEKFVNAGFGVNRRRVMFNDFILVGPGEDPAGIRALKNTTAVMARIASAGEPFVSRGDDSGTHKRELLLWKGSGIEPKGQWYVEAGQGMGAVLTIASEKQGYTLTDRATYLAYRDKIQLEILFEGDENLHNPYSIISVNPQRHPHVKYVWAMALTGWFTSPEGQRIIAGYKKHGEQLFHLYTQE